jgi:cytochrome P450
MNTVKGQLGITFQWLAENPDERQRLMDDPDLLPVAIEEFLRYASPVHGVFRTVTREVELAGKQLRVGDKVYAGFGPSNRDDRAFDEPNRCTMNRVPNRHVAFGLGNHRCVGSQLARVQLRVTLEEVLRRMPDYAVVPDAELTWDVGSVSRGLNNLPVIFTPGARSAG